jgi:hypothetical protein
MSPTRSQDSQDLPHHQNAGDLEDGSQHDPQCDEDKNFLESIFDINKLVEDTGQTDADPKVAYDSEPDG